MLTDTIKHLYIKKQNKKKKQVGKHWILNENLKIENPSPYKIC